MNNSPLAFALFSSLFHIHIFSLSPDGVALLSLIKSHSSIFFSDWNSGDHHPCHWSGITCATISGHPRVVEVALQYTRLHGYIPPQLSTLSYLRRLNLCGNSFYGSIPSYLFNSTSLQSISLSDNNLSGTLPSSLCLSPHLHTIDFSINSLSGAIPEVVRKCHRLQLLNLSFNGFSEEIPRGIFSELSRLVQLDLSSNDFHGFIPVDFNKLVSLSGILNISFNRFYGEIPPLGDLPDTATLDFRWNNLSGEIPIVGAVHNQGAGAFIGNPHLCGFPLLVHCRRRNTSAGRRQKGLELEEGGWKEDIPEEKIIIISTMECAGVTLIGIVIVLVYRRRKEKQICNCISSCSFLHISNGTDTEVESETEGGKGELVVLDRDLHMDMEDLLSGSAYKLGESEKGIMYKVEMNSGISVAVRRVGEGGENRRKEFAVEMEALGRVIHPNIVRVRAYYWSLTEKLIVTDYISNGSLSTALLRSGSLSWMVRMKIAKGIARGLAFLHGCGFVHGEIKASNILLSHDFGPFIADLSLTRLVSIISNSYHAGIEPRLMMTKKCDVYSFGILLVHLVMGKMAAGDGVDSGEGWRRSVLEFMDEKVIREWDGGDMEVVVRLAMEGVCEGLSVVGSA